MIVLRFSVRLRPRALAVGAGGALVAVALGVLAVGGGEYPMSPVEVLRTLAGGGSAVETFIVEDVRLPRVVTALLAGAALALSGAVFQALVRNPLGSPDVLGCCRAPRPGRWWWSGSRWPRSCPG